MFSAIPQIVIDYVRSEFAKANDLVSRSLTTQPSMHEETLDQMLVAQLSASPPTFFAAENAAIAIESHWLGGRRMWHRWEIADIAFFILLKRSGALQARKVALLQTKRLYSREIGGVELDQTDYLIGIGRLVDQIGQSFPLSSQRFFGFTQDSRYDALSAGSEQVNRIDAYVTDRNIPVYYALYHPMVIPYSAAFPLTAGNALPNVNSLGCRVLSSTEVHSALNGLSKGQAPTFKQLGLRTNVPTAGQFAEHGWRLENFIADEVMKCREGRLFEDSDDGNLSSLLYGRSAPISSAIVVTIDIGGEGERSAKRKL